MSKIWREVFKALFLLGAIMCLAKGVQTGDTTCHIFGSLFVVFFCSAINNNDEEED